MKEIVGEPVEMGSEFRDCEHFARVTGRFRVSHIREHGPVDWNDVEIVLRAKPKGGFLVPMTIGQAVDLGIDLAAPEPDRTVVSDPRIGPPAECGPSLLEPIFRAVSDTYRAGESNFLTENRHAADPSQAPDVDEKAAMERFFFGG